MLPEPDKMYCDKAECHRQTLNHRAIIGHPPARHNLAQAAGLGTQKQTYKAP